MSPQGISLSRRDLSRKTKEADSVEELQRIVDQHHHLFDEINLSAAFAKVAKLPRSGQARTALTRRLIELSGPRLHGFTAQGLANTANAL